MLRVHTKRLWHIHQVHGGCSAIHLAVCHRAPRDASVLEHALWQYFGSTPETYGVGCSADTSSYHIACISMRLMGLHTMIFCSTSSGAVLQKSSWYFDGTFDSYGAEPGAAMGKTSATTWKQGLDEIAAAYEPGSLWKFTHQA